MLHNSEDEDSDDSSSSHSAHLECEGIRYKHHMYANHPDGLRYTITWKDKLASMSRKKQVKRKEQEKTYNFQLYSTYTNISFSIKGKLL